MYEHSLDEGRRETLKLPNCTFFLFELDLFLNFFIVLNWWFMQLDIDKAFDYQNVLCTLI